jgi:phosphonate transport system substrate-binding protein
MAENTERFCQDIAGYIGDKIGVETEYVAGISWQERERMFDAGEIHVLWLCGLPYIHKAELSLPDMELLAAPVPLGHRYENRPIYFSDVIVHRESSHRCFADLRGRAWAYNEPRSHSGYNVVRAYLAGRGESRGFFARVVESGAHMNSLQMILDGDVDGAAVDSTVLEWACNRWPEMAERLRVIETLGPSPIPPWVVTNTLSTRRQRELRSLLLNMHHDQNGCRILNQGRIACFLASSDQDYDPIRRMANAAETVVLQAV